jgi:hypothetical protein
MGRNLILWKPREITSNVVLGQYYRTYQNILTQSNDFFVVDILSIMVVEKNNTMEAKEIFEGLPKYYVKMNVKQFVEQWVTHELYHELLKQTQIVRVPLSQEKKIAITSNAYTMGIMRNCVYEY